MTPAHAQTGTLTGEQDPSTAWIGTVSDRPLVTALHATGLYDRTYA